MVNGRGVSDAGIADGAVIAQRSKDLSDWVVFNQNLKDGSEDYPRKL